MKAIDLSGQTFGSWEVTGVGPSTPHRDTKRKNWNCKCTKCGYEFFRPTDTVRFNKDEFCRNCHPMFVFHGLRDHPLYTVHCGIRERCANKPHRWRQWYYDRGIRVCEEWSGAKGFMPFYMWAPGLEIDRIDNDKGYSPENCHFVTHTENINNNSLTHQYLVNGIEIISRKELIRRFAACSRFQVDRRLAAGLSLLEALVTPLKTEKKRKTPLEMLESVEIISSPEPPSIKYMSEAQQKAYYSKRSVG